MKKNPLEEQILQTAEELFLEKGFDAKFGARPLLRTIQRELEDPLAHFILTSRAKAGAKIQADFDKDAGKLIFSAVAAGKRKAVLI